MNHAEFSMSDAVAIPLIDELAGLIEMDYARRSYVVGGVVGTGVIGTFVRVALTNVDVTVGSEGEVERLPEESLAYSFVPITPSSLDSQGCEKFPVRAEL